MTVTYDQKVEVHAKLEEVFKKAKAHYGSEIDIELDDIIVEYNIKGFKMAGEARYRTRGGETQYYIRFNPTYFQYPDAYKHMIESTVGHELCHIMDHNVRGEMDHGRCWKRMMVVCGLDPERCHNVDISQMGYVRKSKPRPHKYQCDCQDHMESTKMHNKMQRRTMLTGWSGYTCRSCKGRLVYVGSQVQAPVARAASVAKPKPTSGLSKKDQAKAIFAQESDRGRIISRFMTELNMGKAGASTYYYNINSGKW